MGVTINIFHIKHISNVRFHNFSTKWSKEFHDRVVRYDDFSSTILAILKNQTMEVLRTRKVNILSFMKLYHQVQLGFQNIVGNTGHPCSRIIRWTGHNSSDVEGPKVGLVWKWSYSPQLMLLKYIFIRLIRFGASMGSLHCISSSTSAPSPHPASIDHCSFFLRLQIFLW